MNQKEHIALSTFSIKDIETITGIKAHTLRIWEQRYKLIEPKRTSTNIRYYSDEDLRFILNISVLNNHGVKISEIAKMEPEKIKEMVLVISEKSSPYASQIKALIATMFSLDEEGFNRILANNILRQGLEETMIQVVFPFLHQIGVLWVTGSIHPAHEHFITNLIRQKLFVAIDAQTGKVSREGKKFLLFLPQGEPHEIGLLFANYMLRVRGHEVVYLGQNLPFEDLRSVFDFYEPEYVMSVLTTGMNESEVQKFVNTLAKSWPDAQIMVTGYLVVTHPSLKLPSNVMVLDSVDTMRKTVEGLHRMAV
ncbi:MAG: MerR family transcriptional regulator [Bacteroidota bacterium]|nr:MerR family transcriptional regulator [Bacteroidota bacterium]MDX5429494.1 MerR family transcriptional regulator [Bacteroidota bacterium]MDX5468279.1 MerR family transcriptional regulator [Bacteroidota bacterium]